MIKENQFNIKSHLRVLYLKKKPAADKISQWADAMGNFFNIYQLHS